MYTDKKRTAAQDEIRRRDQVIFAHILTPVVFFQAARMCGLRLVLSPLNLINLVWLAVSCARNPELCFADILGLSRKTLEDHESYPRNPATTRARPLTSLSPRKPSPRRESVCPANSGSPCSSCLASGSCCFMPR